MAAAPGLAHVEGQQHVVGQRVGVDVGVGAHRVADLDVAQQLRSLHPQRRPGGERPVREVDAAEHPRRPQERQRESTGSVVADVDQLVFEQALVHDGEATGLHEPAGRERGKAALVGTAFRREPA